MLGISSTELVLILAFAFIIFGPDKLPGMGRTLGRALRQFRNAQEGFTQVVQSEVIDPATEAMGVDGKKPNRKRAEELEEDADIDVPEGADADAPKRTETFAERKRRLAEEKAARDAAAREEEKAADADPQPDADEEPAPKRPSAADLYALSPKSAGGQAGPAAADDAPSDPTPGKEA